LHVALHPTQMYDAGAEFLILALILGTERFWRRHTGWTFWVYILLYAISRFAIEFFRGDPRGASLGFSTSQWISMGLVPLSLVMLFVLSRLGPGPAPATAGTAAPQVRKKKRGR
jgi:phosphatidylglycerol:prolipoprotein diacylglycerol transferase